MPVRIASLARQLDKNGQRLHRVIASRAFSHGADPAPSDEERALREERSALKAAQAERRARAALPRVKPAKMVKEAKPPSRRAQIVAVLAVIAVMVWLLKD